MMPLWLAILCMVAVVLTAAYLLHVILRPEKY